MEFIRKQKVIRQRFAFRMIVFFLSSLCCVLYAFYSLGSPQIWGIVIGISASALVWSIVEICDFFINTYYEYETERSAFLKITTMYFSKIKDIIRDNVEEIPMHEIKQVINELYSEMTNIELSFNEYCVDKNYIKKDITGNIGETFTIPDNVYVTYTFIPDLDFCDLYRKDKSNMVRTIFNLILRKISCSDE